MENTSHDKLDGTRKTTYILSVSDDQIVVNRVEFDYDRFTSRIEFQAFIRSIDDLEQFLANAANDAGVAIDDLRVACSSTMDFPEEETSNPDTIALARQIRGDTGGLL